MKNIFQCKGDGFSTDSIENSLIDFSTETSPRFRVYKETREEGKDPSYTNRRDKSGQGKVRRYGPF